MDKGEILLNLHDIYCEFADDLSRELFICRVSWLITKERKYIERIVKLSHADMPIWNQKEEKLFLDLLPKDKKIIFYGTGSFAERLIPYLKESLLDVWFCDTDANKWDTDFFGYKVINPERLFGDITQSTIVICSTKYYKEIEEFLYRNGINKEDLVDIREFFCLGTGDEYFYEDFLNYEENETFIDAGCYDLSTTIDFKRVCKGLTKSYAFEPDRINYERCIKRIENEKDKLSEVVMYPCGTWSSKTELRFSATADGSSHIGEGECVINTVSIDECVDKSDKITFIKMDVEGAELESLKGAQETIKRDKPKLAICIYHKPEDMYTLPLYIKSLVPEYKLYLRSYSNAEHEMVLYAVL